MSEAVAKNSVVIALTLAIGLHLLFFVAAKPALDEGVMGVPVAPATSYLARSSDAGGVTSEEVRLTRSPVLFALPTRMGFSEEMLNQRVRTPRIQLNQEDPALFLEPSVAPRAAAPASAELMLTATQNAAPPVPHAARSKQDKRSPMRRVILSSELKGRLVGGVVLPVELNQNAEKPWEANATVSVSEGGVVRHVLLDAPIASAELNQHVLGVLYGLRFQPGEAVEGAITIYSPEPAAEPAEEGAP